MNAFTEMSVNVEKYMRKENQATPKVTFGFLRNNEQTACETGNKARSASLRMWYNSRKRLLSTHIRQIHINVCLAHCG